MRPLFKAAEPTSPFPPNSSLPSAILAFTFLPFTSLPSPPEPPLVTTDYVYHAMPCTHYSPRPSPARCSSKRDPTHTERQRDTRDREIARNAYFLIAGGCEAGGGGNLFLFFYSFFPLSIGRSSVVS